MLRDGFERANAIFTADVIERLAHFGRFPKNADLHLFGELLRTAAGFYFEDMNEAQSNKVHREVKALYEGKIGIEAVSQTTVRLLQYRAQRLGITWQPSREEIMRLTAHGGMIAPDTKREKYRRGLTRSLSPRLRRGD